MLKYFQNLAFLIGIFLGGHSAFALVSTTTLPQGINSPSFRYGVIDGIGEKYLENGRLVDLGDSKSVVFDAETLAKFNSDAQRLIDALNRFGAARLGDNFNLGVLRIETKPRVHYFAPVYARGLTEQWTMGLGLPIVTYTNKITISQQFSNIEYYRREFSNLSPELDEALNTDLAKATNQTLEAKGYKAITDRKEQFLADAQLVSVYRFAEQPGVSSWAYQMSLNLPTGPAYDSDDLAALNIFGRTNINNTLIYSHSLPMNFTFVPFVSYLLNVPDQVTVRVPKNEDDTLPDESSKERVRRSIGDSVTGGANILFDYTDKWSFGGGYDYQKKLADKYTGGRDGRYDLLALNTETSRHRIVGSVSYSTVKSYFAKQSLIPTILSFEVSDVISGVNIERQLVQEVNWMLFF